MGQFIITNNVFSKIVIQNSAINNIHQNQKKFGKYIKSLEMLSKNVFFGSFYRLTYSNYY